MPPAEVVEPLTPAQLAKMREEARPWLLASWWKGFLLGLFFGFIIGWGVWSVLFFQRQ